MSGGDFLQQLRATFKVEAEEHLQAVSTRLAQMEEDPKPALSTGLVDEIFRAVHSLKGAARAVDYRDIESLCQMLEDLFESWERNENIPPSSEWDPLYRALDAIRATLDSKEGDATRVARPELPALRKALRRLAGSFQPVASTDTPQIAFCDAVATPEASQTAISAATAIADTVHPGVADTVRVAVTKLDAGLLQAEELLTAKLAAGQRVADLRELIDGLEHWKKAWLALQSGAYASNRSSNAEPAVDIAPLPPAGSQLLEFIARGMDTLRSLECSAAAKLRAAEHDRDIVGKLVDRQLEGAKRLLLLPFSTITTSFAKMVRDLCRELGKEAAFLVHGGDIEIDKHILEDIKDPLIHLLRNSVDHGLETTQERIRQGKPPKAVITLAASRIDGSKVQISLSDNGAGIDTGEVRRAAVKRGLLSAEAAAQLNDPDAQDLVFQPDVSTSPSITALSGRGLGLAIVREKVEKLGGQVVVESSRSSGTTFRITVSSMRATFHGVVLEAAGQLFMVPTAEVERVGRVRLDSIQTIEGQESVTVDGRALALVQLADVLELALAKPAEPHPASVVMIVLGSGDKRIAFAVDSILDEQEVLVKPLCKPLSRVRNISGVTVLGSGRVVPILHVGDLLKSARRQSDGWMRQAIPGNTVRRVHHNILVAEDSITSRMLLKGILESAGYRVRTAVDGMEAFMLLRAEKFDLLVSDVEMPRLNGFDLTRQVRAHAGLADLPVILVTALESREDRERGVDAGASAYIVKRSFDQSNLLEAVHRLL